MIRAFRNGIGDTKFWGNSFNRNDFAASEQANWHKATVYGAISRPTIGIASEERDRASSAITFSATFLGACQAGRTEVFKQSGVRGAVIDANRIAIQNEFKSVGHNGYFRKDS